MTTRAEEREQIGAQARFDILSRDQFTCQACSASPGNDRLNVDHLLPWSLGGSNDPLNLTTLCDRCNNGKRARIWIPPRLLLAPFDDEGFAIWKRFGPWTVEVSLTKIVVHLPRTDGVVMWFNIQRCWEFDWIDHCSMKNWSTTEIEIGLFDALEFARAIYRKPVAR